MGCHFLLIYNYWAAIDKICHLILAALSNPKYPRTNMYRRILEFD